MSLFPRIPGAVFTDPTLPKAYIDPMLTKGTLLLVDPSHPYAPWSASVPASGALLPNVASAAALALLGSATAAAAQPSYFYGGNLAGVRGLVERSGKGGLHGIVSQQLADTPYTASQDIRLSAEQRAYLFARRNDRWYFSQWKRITRAVALTELRAAFLQMTSGDSNYLTVLQSEGDLPASSYSTNRGAVGNSFTAVETTSWVNGWGTATGLDDARAAQWGRNSNWTAAHSTKKAPSFILYRATIENLTVSGRTYEQARAADLALYEKEVLTVGGRYYADTFTEPTTIP